LKVSEKNGRQNANALQIKRAASRNTSQCFCSTFNFAQPHLNPGCS